MRYCDNRKKKSPDIVEGLNELKSYRKMYSDVQSDKLHHEELKQNLYGLKVFCPSERVQSSPKPNTKIDAIIDKMTVLEEVIAAGILKMYETQQQIVETIKKISFPASEILTRRYIQFQTYEEIAYRMTYSYDRVRHIACYDGVTLYVKAKKTAEHSRNYPL